MRINQAIRGIRHFLAHGSHKEKSESHVAQSAAM
jgi:hypothetical protein